MRQLQDIEKRWSLLFNTSIGVDLRQAIRDDGDFDPCEDGLRFGVLETFLLTGPLSNAWSRKLKDQRSGYTSLRDHFLKFINNPNDLHSLTDPLADDDTSPWATFRQDEVSREEIWQDVIRCNIDNYFFREPSTQRMLLDVLFIYSKLNPDTGYRQGMHEILAPVLWVVYQDSIDTKSVPEGKKGEEGIDLMLDVLDSRYCEHDAFNLFCAVMQTAKTFYEVGDNKDSSAIVAHSERIHNELLGAVDPDLSMHLQVVGIVPQIYAIRWLRLLFGREMEFKDVLKLWDILFAESLSVDIIDMSCVAILLRLRWQLIDADYTTAITTLTRLNLPKEGDSARAIVRDAIQLANRKTPTTGADIMQLRTGRRPYINPMDDDTPKELKSQQASPSPSPARFATPQRHLESLFTNVSSNIQKGAQGWSVQNVSKAVKGAVGEARKNFEQLQSNHSRNSSLDIPRPSMDGDQSLIHASAAFGEQLKKLQERNMALAKMLENAQESLRKWRSETAQPSAQGEDVFNTALAKIQFVSVYLTDSEIPIPPSTPVVEKKPTEKDDPVVVDASIASAQPQESGTGIQHDQPVGDTRRTEAKAAPGNEIATRQTAKPTVTAPTARKSSPSPVHSPPVRPTLAESSFSFMLGDDRHRTSFIRSKPLPEERRNSDVQKQKEKERKNSNESKVKPKQKQSKDRKDKKSTAGTGEGSDDDGFTMTSFQ